MNKRIIAKTSDDTEIAEYIRTSYIGQRELQIEEYQYIFKIIQENIKQIEKKILELENDKSKQTNKKTET